MALPLANHVNAINVLTNLPKPKLSFLQVYQWDTSLQATNNDNDGRVDAGETIDLGIVIRNHWGKADNVTVTLDAWPDDAFQPDPCVTILTNTVNYGAIGSFNWDDNGIIAGPQQAPTGVQHPFTFRVSPNCPNDHVIPFGLTMTCRNGLNTNDPVTYTFRSSFYLMVVNGRELPRIISQEMTLSKEFYWIVPGPTLVESNATLTVTEGTQIQVNYTAPYTFVQVAGTMKITGTLQEPVERFGSGYISSRWGDSYMWGKMENVVYAK